LRRRISAKTSTSVAPGIARVRLISAEAGAQERIGPFFEPDGRRDRRLILCAQRPNLFHARLQILLPGSSVSAKRPLLSVYSWPQ
jgi:hypothetical protein